MQRVICLILIVCLSIASGAALADKKPKKQDKVNYNESGLNSDAMTELRDAGVNKYLGKSVSTKSEHGVWTRHDFDPQYTFDPSYPSGFRPDGPVCIAGSDYSVFSRKGNPKKLLIFLQGGGACWQDFYACNILAVSQDGFPGQEPPENGPFPGVFDPTMSDNPFADYSVVYMPYCDGSTFGGDNDVNDSSFPFGPTRHHRGLRNVSAGMDVAKEMFPRAKQITVMGHSAGGVGVAAFAPFLTRFTFGNNSKLTVYNDAGPIAVNLGVGSPPGTGEFPFGCFDISCLSVVARAFDWQFHKFYPQSCIDDGHCDAFGQQTGIIHWRLANDSTIREAFYETDSDRTNRFFAQGDGSRMDPQIYRDLILTEHGALNDAYPRRYKRFIVSGDDTHGAIQATATTPNSASAEELYFLFYTQQANGTLLSKWAAEFARIGQRQSKFGWKDVVEDYVPVANP
ncbi:MAG: pectin acetylesterase-family hydrolase [Pseudomonadota bacterium]